MFPVQHFHMEHLEPWYVTGLCDGDGSFTYSRNGKSAALYFAVKMNSADRPLLERLRRYFGGGEIYDVKPRKPRANAGWTKKAVYYRVSNLNDLASVVEHFDRWPPQGRRAEVYRVWRELYLLRTRFWRTRMPEGVAAHFHGLIDKLSSLSPRNQQWDGEI